MTDIDDRYDDQDHDATDSPDGFGTFDDYRAQKADRRAAEAVTTVILGEEVTLPDTLPFGFELRMHRLGAPETTQEQAIELLFELVAMLYGDDAADAWGDDLDDDDLQLLIVWGAANTRKPYSMTFVEAAEAVEAEEGKAQRAAKGRPVRRQTRSKRPKRGGSSKR